jgi:protein TonB
MNEPSVHSSPGVESEETSSEEDIGAASFREPGHEEEYGTGRPYVTEFGGADGPRFLKKVTPSYPLMARRLGKEGRVLLRLLIDNTGTLLGIEVVDNAEYGFDRAAVEAVEKSTFLPAVKNGKSVVSQSLLSVKFVLTAE